jgi:acyl carrier protein
MIMGKTERQVMNVLAKLSGRAIGTIKPESSLEPDLGMDSLDMQETAMLVEGEFDIEISDSELDGCETAGDLIALVISKERT